MLFTNISELLTMDYKKEYLRGSELNQLNIIKNAYLHIENGKVASYGEMKDCYIKDETIDQYFEVVQAGLASKYHDLSNMDRSTLTSLLNLVYTGVVNKA